MHKSKINPNKRSIQSMAIRRINATCENENLFSSDLCRKDLHFVSTPKDWWKILYGVPYVCCPLPSLYNHDDFGV